MTKNKRILLWTLWPIALLAASVLFGSILMPIAGNRVPEADLSLLSLMGYDGINKVLFLAWVLPLAVALFAIPWSWGYAIYISWTTRKKT